MRALRKHHRYRLIKKRKRDIWWIREKSKEYDDFNGVIANTPCPCSCYMCGNPRKWWKAATHEERMAKLLYIEGCEESDIYCSLNRNQLGKLEG